MKEEEKKCTRIRERKGKGRARGVCCAGTGLRGGGKEQYPGELGIEGLSNENSWMDGCKSAELRLSRISLGAPRRSSRFIGGGNTNNRWGFPAVAEVNRRG
ncbi:Uncharacterized protein HZ326_8897 [Fusarium oxysporum f. sp. albedinis]|nr:Uncharacterized protein HZ326_8897 [Fusarium oxysporum f. sp. albedinis]